MREQLGFYLFENDILRSRHVNTLYHYQATYTIEDNFNCKSEIVIGSLVLAERQFEFAIEIARLCVFPTFRNSAIKHLGNLVIVAVEQY